MVSIGYIWFFAGIAAFTPFAALYYRGLGFSGVQVGILAALPAIALAVTGAWWGAVADTLAAHRLMLRVALLLGAVFAFAASRTQGFPLLLMWIVLLSFSIVPIRSLLDHYAVLIGSRVGRPFGRIRLWGALGYTTFALTLGRAMNEHVTSLFLVAYAVSLLLTCASTFFLPQLPRVEHHPVLAGLREMVRNTSLMLLLLVAFAQAVAASLIVVVLGVHIKSLGGETSQVGAAFAIAAVSELPVFLAGSWLYARVGPRRMIIAIMALYAVRLALLGVVTDPAGVVALQALHGVTFGAFLIAGVPWAHALAGKHHPATAQAMLTMISFGFGNVVGSFMGGAMLDVTSTANVFRIVSIGLAVVLVVFILGWRRLGIAEFGSQQD